MTFKTWIGGTGNWSTPSQWSDGVPASGDAVGIFSTASSADDVMVQGLTLANNAISLIRGGTATLTVNFDDVTIGKRTTINTVGEGGPIALTLDDTTSYGSISDGFGVIDATIDSGAAFVNHGLIKATGEIGKPSIAITDNGSFTNTGSMIAGYRGTETVLFGDVYTGQKTTINNAGLIKATDAGTVDLHGSRGYILNFGTVNNTGLLEATNGGTLSIDADIVQTGHGKVIANSGGIVFLSGNSSGGSYQIDNATLSFGNFGRGSAFPIAASGFQSTLKLGGLSDTLSFGAAVITEALSSDAHHLLISSFPYGRTMAQVADIQLDPKAHYTASQFAVQGSSIIWTAHPTA